jgi:pimeloyl-ACP methyl ester carboxylesterase
LLQLFREAPRKGQLLRSLALGNKGGDRTVISTDGTPLSVRKSGDGAPVVIVHGTLDGIGAFSLVELQLAERYSVWVYDRRGRGGSGDTVDHALDREVDDLRAVVSAVGAAPHVLAHSFGAVVALRARLAGVEMRSLTVYEPPINSDAIPAQVISDIRDAVEAGRVDDAIGMMARDLAGITDDELAIAMAVPPVRKRLRDGVRTAPRELDALRACSWDDLPLTGVPTLVLRGERHGSDAYPDAEQAGGIAAGAERATLSGQGHLGHVFAPTAFAVAVRAFLDRH